MGSWLLYGLGTENENLPGYVVLRPTPKIVVGPALWSNSFLPAEFIARLFSTVNALPNLEPTWNMAPTKDTPVVRLHPSGERHLNVLKWDPIE
jgi:hypothetical protein